MKNRIGILVATLVSTIPVACNFCDADEERAISASGLDSLTVNFGAQALRLQFGSRVGNRELPAASFDPVFSAIQNPVSSPTRAIVIPLSATETGSNQQVLIALALPGDLTRGDVYTVNGTFTVEPGFSTDPAAFGTRALQGANNAQIAVTRWLYSFPPPTFTVTYRASSATGTIRVTQRSSGFAELELNVQVTDPAKGAASFSGRVQLATERHTPPCIS